MYLGRLSALKVVWHIWVMCFNVCADRSICLLCNSTRVLQLLMGNIVAKVIITDLNALREVCHHQSNDHNRLNQNRSYCHNFGKFSFPLKFHYYLSNAFIYGTFPNVFNLE